MAVHSLKPATDRCFGRPLPCQLANQTRAHPVPINIFTPKDAFLCAYAVLAVISNCYPPVQGRLPTRYSPVRHSVRSVRFRRLRPKCFVRLACVKHAASVYPEPGSNSHVQFSVQFCANAFLSVCVSYLKDFTVFIGCSLYYAKNFTRLTAFAIRLFKKSSGLVILFNYQGSLCFVLSVSATASIY